MQCWRPCSLRRRDGDGHRQVVSTRDVTLGGAIRRESFLLAKPRETRHEKEKKSQQHRVFSANMDAYPQLLVSSGLFVSCRRLFWTRGHSATSVCVCVMGACFADRPKANTDCMGMGVKRPGTVPNGTPQVPTSHFLPSHELNSPANLTFPCHPNRALGWRDYLGYYRTHPGTPRPPGETSHSVDVSAPARHRRDRASAGRGCREPL